MTQNTPPEAQNQSLSAVHRLLAQIPELCLNLAQNRIDGPQRAARSPRTANSKPPTNLDRIVALDLRQRIRDLNHHDQLWRDGQPRQGILPTLWLWATMLEADWLDQSPQLPAGLPEQPTVASLCNWLTTHDHLWHKQPEWDEYSTDIEALNAWAKRLVGWQPEPTCPTCGVAFTRHGEHLWRCRHCGREISTRIVGVTLKMASSLTGVPERTLRDWVSRQGLLPPLTDGAGVQRDKYGAKLFDLDLIRRLAGERRERRLA